MRNLVLAGVLLGTAAVMWMAWRGRSPVAETREMAAPVVVRQPANIAKRTFDPANPPADMPPLSAGEAAQCVSDFLSNATVSGQTRRTDPTHATVTITQIHMTLQLNVNIWTPIGASQQVMEHEEGHRQISEYYYQTADQLAARIASTYMGKQIEVSGEDSGSAASEALQQAGAEITGEYNKELNPNPTQLLYDSITDHARNGVVAQDAVDHALKNASVEAVQPIGADPTQNR
ncbi:MAG TPA: hypothetical protein VNZ56_10760 [Verrucomicrobiae bacterium]|nr:hypothetical protein [Verrucomicrobiae bacterium]